MTKPPGRLKKAQARAQTYAKSLACRCPHRQHLREQQRRFPPDADDAHHGRRRGDGQGHPVAPGESTVSVNLDVVFELGR
jgi:uncharacterized protein YggE